MYERSTDHRTHQEGQEVYPTAEASDSEGMGTKRKWGGSCSQVSDSSSYPVSVEKGTGARSKDLFERQEKEGRSQDKGAGRGEPETKRSPCHPDPGVDVAKKKDELGLSNRRKGCTYSGVQRQRIINAGLCSLLFPVYLSNIWKELLRPFLTISKDLFGCFSCCITK